MTAENQPEQPQAQDTIMGQLAIQKVYVKDLSFEAPNAPQVFNEELQPTVDVHFSNATDTLGDDQHHVVLTVTVEVKQGDKTIYLAEVQQAGIFTISGFPAQHMPAILATACPNILFPFARETVSDIVTRGGFPQLLLAPINFDMLYAQEMQRRREGAEAKPAH